MVPVNPSRHSEEWLRWPSPLRIGRKAGQTCRRRLDRKQLVKQADKLLQREALSGRANAGAQNQSSEEPDVQPEWPAGRQLRGARGAREARAALGTLVLGGGGAVWFSFGRTAWRVGS